MGSIREAMEETVLRKGALGWRVGALPTGLAIVYVPQSLQLSITYPAQPRTNLNSNA